MEIILRQDIPNLGYSNDLVKVKDGYGRNFLIPQGKAVLATSSAKKVREEVLKQKAFKEERLRNEATVMAEKLEGLSVKVGAKAAASGKIFGSVNNIQIADALKEQHDVEVDRKKVSVSSVKELGTYTATIKLYKEIEASISFEVFGE
ncbi:MAG: 50S ribosomal protein L9 [Bacteroidales bacterium]|nr:50S ribosomal protein L9 [Bacteroidales bacterium]